MNKLIAPFFIVISLFILCHKDGSLNKTKTPDFTFLGVKSGVCFAKH